MFVSSNLSIPPAEFRFSFARSSGPGGQNVNKVNSKVTLHWNVVSSPSLPVDVRNRFVARYGGRMNHDGDLVLQSQRFRDQIRNRGDCLEKLRALLLAVLLPPKQRRRTKPSRASRERRIRNKRLNSDKKRMRRGPTGSD